MADLLEARTISVSIARSPEEVYAFVADPVNLPRWASGMGTSVERVQGELIARSAQGQVKLRFAERNDFGVLDHYVSPAPGVEIYLKTFQEVSYEKTVYVNLAPSISRFWGRLYDAI